MLVDQCPYHILNSETYSSTAFESQSFSFFEKVFGSQIPEKDALKCILDETNTEHELSILCQNKKIVDKILKNFILANSGSAKFDYADHFNEIIKNDTKQNTRTIFDVIEDKHKDDQNLIKSVALNKYVRSFNEEQRNELTELIQNNELARNRLIEIFENHLESNFDFDSLMKYLKKIEKKNLLNI